MSLRTWWRKRFGDPWAEERRPFDHGMPPEDESIDDEHDPFDDWASFMTPPSGQAAEVIEQLHDETPLALATPDDAGSLADAGYGELADMLSEPRSEDAS